MNERLLVSLVDDDQSCRESLPELLKELGFSPRAFSSAEEFLASDAVLHSRCLLLDVDDSLASTGAGKNKSFRIPTKTESSPG